MFVKTLLSTLLINSVACYYDSTTNGVSGSFEIDVLSQAKDIYFDKILAAINTVQIPDIVIDKNHYMKENSFVLNQAANNVQFTTDIANNAIVLTCNDLTAQFITKDFRYKEFIFIATGLAEVDLNKIEISLGIDFVTQNLTDGRVVPALRSVDVVVDIDRNDLKFHIQGNIWTDMASVFIPFFKGTVIDLITSTVTDALDTTVPAVANTALAATDGMTELVPNMFVDWETFQAVQVTETALEFGARMLLFDSLFGEVVPSAWPEMPYKDANQTSGVQVFISDAAVNSALAAVLQYHPVTLWLNATEIPATAPIQLTTGDLNKVFAGLSDYYGPNQPVNVYIDLQNLYNFAVTAGKE